MVFWLRINSWFKVELSCLIDQFQVKVEICYL